MGFFYFIGGEIIFILGVIPARAGSKGIPGKNIYPLNGRPLIEYAIEGAGNSQLDSYCITTDLEELRHRYAGFIYRPERLCQDGTPMLPVVQHAIKIFEDDHRIFGNTDYVDVVMILQPTSPLRTVEDINNAIQVFKDSNADSLYSGYYIGIKHKAKTYDKHTDKPHFQRNGAIFIAKRDLIEKGKLWSDSVIEFEMPKSRSIDIDDMDDMFMAEAILKHREATV